VHAFPAISILFLIIVQSAQGKLPLQTDTCVTLAIT
jgi:hypothetical protein